MVTSGTHHQTTDPRRLIQRQKLGERLSTQEQELIQKFREKERVRQKNLRQYRKLVFGFPKKRGRKPSALKSDAAQQVNFSSVYIPGTDDLNLIARYYQGQTYNRSTVESPVEISFNGYQWPPMGSIDGLLVADVNNRQVIYPQSQYGHSPPTNSILTISRCVPLQTAYMSELHQPTSDSLCAVSQPLDREPSAACYSACDGYSIAASRAPSTPSCTSASSIRSIGRPLLFSSSSPASEATAFSPEFETSPDEAYFGIYQPTSAIADHVSVSYLGPMPDGKWTVTPTFDFDDLGGHIA
ncbi:hypothetical protein V1508DRAFT_13464 [Lipomyces doorenjongii]|uniref:uncharacterized protein n=1 Tax=Lipomyces doorenjongii TaxID=383834 RepID=UPI0034CFCCDA